MTVPGNSEQKTLKERAQATIDVRAELTRLEQMIDKLKVDYEQYFMGIITQSPDKLHAEVRKLVRTLIKAPFKNSQMTFTLRALESRYQTYNTYWMRVLKQREEGTYFKDVFKAGLREKINLEREEAGTAKGKAREHVQSIFNSYKNALEKQTGKKQNLDYQAFEKTLMSRAKEFKKQHAGKKLVFSVVVQDGKVSLKAKAK